MGRGNWKPSPDHNRSWEMVYVEYEQFNDCEFTNDEICDMHNMWYYDFEVNLKSILPKSFKLPSKQTYVSWGRDIRLFAENDLFELCFADNEYALAVTLIVKEDAPAFADSQLNKTFMLITYKLWELYDLRVRCGPWTSGEWIIPNSFHRVKVWDNKGKSNDNYTIKIIDKEYKDSYIYAMNSIPFNQTFGFNQFVGENLKENKSWGKEVSLIKLPIDVLNAIKLRLE